MAGLQFAGMIGARGGDLSGINRAFDRTEEARQANQKHALLQQQIRAEQAAEAFRQQMAQRQQAYHERSGDQRFGLDERRFGADLGQLARQNSWEDVTRGWAQQDRPSDVARRDALDEYNAMLRGWTAEDRPRDVARQRSNDAYTDEQRDFERRFGGMNPQVGQSALDDLLERLKFAGRERGNTEKGWSAEEAARQFLEEKRNREKSQWGREDAANARADEAETINLAQLRENAKRNGMSLQDQISMAERLYKMASENGMKPEIVAARWNHLMSLTGGQSATAGAMDDPKALAAQERDDIIRTLQAFSLNPVEPGTPEAAARQKQVEALQAALARTIAILHGGGPELRQFTGQVVPLSEPPTASLSSLLQESQPQAPALPQMPPKSTAGMNLKERFEASPEFAEMPRVRNVTDQSRLRLVAYNKFMAREKREQQARDAVREQREAEAQRRAYPAGG